MSSDIKLTPRELHYIIFTKNASICYMESIIAKIIEKLKSCVLYNRTIIIILADHGEALWEHGFFGHYVHLYDEISRIPFIIKIPSPAGEELYNLWDDPQEKTNLMGSTEVIEIENYFRQQLSIWLHQQRSLRSIYSAVERASEIDEATIENLKALGYITN